MLLKIINTIALVGLARISKKTVDKSNPKPQAVKLTNKNEKLVKEIDNWMNVRRATNVAKGLSAQTMREEELEQSNFLSLLQIAESMVKNECSQCFWILFDDFIDESDYLQLVRLDARGREESRITIHR